MLERTFDHGNEMLYLYFFTGLAILVTLIYNKVDLWVAQIA